MEETTNNLPGQGAPPQGPPHVPGQPEPPSNAAVESQVSSPKSASEVSMGASIMYSIKSWIASKGGWAHVVLIAWLGILGAYAKVPEFHKAVIDVWAVVPPLLREVIVGVASAFAWYKSTQKLNS